MPFAWPRILFAIKVLRLEFRFFFWLFEISNFLDFRTRPQAVITDNVEALNSELKRKRDEINHLLDVNARIEDENRALTAVNEENQLKMTEASEYMDNLTEKYKKMEAMVTSRDVRSEEVTMDIERKDAEILRLKQELLKRDQEADAILDEG